MYLDVYSNIAIDGDIFGLCSQRTVSVFDTGHEGNSCQLYMSIITNTSHSHTLT